jgi:hypothetical protein
MIYEKDFFISKFIFIRNFIALFIQKDLFKETFSKELLIFYIPNC